VDKVPVDAEGRAELRIAGEERAVLAIMGTTPFTTEPATYTYTVGTP
jgi:hypothetical protein